jgi:hypothetical protein
MVVPIEQDLYRPLQGPVHMEREIRGKFVIRRDPDLINDARVAIVGRKFRARLDEATRRERVQVRLHRLS